MSMLPLVTIVTSGTVLGSTYHRYKEDDTQYLRLSAQSNIALKETLCYKLSYDVYQMVRQTLVMGM